MNAMEFSVYIKKSLTEGCHFESFIEALYHSLLKVLLRTMCESVDPCCEAIRMWYGDLEAGLTTSSWIIGMCPQKGFRN